MMRKLIEWLSYTPPAIEYTAAEHAMADAMRNHENIGLPVSASERAYWLRMARVAKTALDEMGGG